MNQTGRSKTTKTWALLNSNFSIVVSGFLLTGFVGQYLSKVHQDNAWERETRYELFRQEIVEANKVLEEVTESISKRTYAMQKLHWALEEGDVKSIEQASKEYQIVKDDWNTQIIVRRNKLKRLVDPDLAYILLDSNNGSNVAKDASVQAAFLNAHSHLASWKNCVMSEACLDRAAREATAKQSLTELYEFADRFTDEAYKIFLSNYVKLREPGA